MDCDSVLEHLFPSRESSQEDPPQVIIETKEGLEEFWSTAPAIAVNISDAVHERAKFCEHQTPEAKLRYSCYDLLDEGSHIILRHREQTDHVKTFDILQETREEIMKGAVLARTQKMARVTIT